MNETDTLNLAEVGDEFVSIREPRLRMLGKFVRNYYCFVFVVDVNIVCIQCRDIWEKGVFACVGTGHAWPHQSKVHCYGPDNTTVLSWRQCSSCYM